MSDERPAVGSGAGASGASSSGSDPGSGPSTGWAPPPPLDPSRPIYHRLILPWARAMSRYHRMTLEGGPPPRGPCIYVALHGAGYLVHDLVLACYLLQWKPYFERGEPLTPLRIVGAESKIERFLPGLPAMKKVAGIIGVEERSCLSVLERGEQLLITPGGSREAQPARDFYRLRWEGRYGFVRLALKTGVPIVPLAVVGGARAFPGFKVKKLSFWSPIPLPARLRMALGQPIPVERRPEAARDMDAVRPIQELAWRRTQALYDRILGRAERAQP